MYDVTMLLSAAGTEGIRSTGSSVFFGDGYMLTWILCIAAMIFAMVCSARVNSTFARYNGEHSRKGMQAWQAARQILDNNGLHDVAVVRVSGHLTDQYDPSTNTVSLSDSVYDSTSLSAIGVAAHECGHAVQHATGYIPIKLRTAIVPLANLGSRAYFTIFLLGLLFSFPLLVNIGIWLFFFVVLFQLVTLPVEFNASSRAMRTLESQLILDSDELPAARKTLTAAAMTYVASLVVSVTQLLRLMTRARSSRR